VGNYIGLAAVLLTAASAYIQYRQIKEVSVPLVPWGQVVLWLSGIACGLLAFLQGIHFLMTIPVTLAVVTNIFFLVVIATSKLPKVDPALEIGDRYIDFTATDSEGNSFTLSQLEGRPILLKFFRGHWCQYCRNELAAYTKFAGAYKELGIEMVVLSADTVEEARKMKEDLRIDAVVLSDENLEIIDKYRVRHEKAVTGARQIVRPVSVPTAMLITADGIVRWIEVSTNNRVRVDPLTVLINSKTVLSQCKARENK